MERVKKLMFDVNAEVAQLLETVKGLEKWSTYLDKELDNVQCENATFRDENAELDELREENDMLAMENKNMAKHLLANDYSADDVDNVCKGFDVCMDDDPNEPTPSQMNEELRNGGW